MLGFCKTEFCSIRLVVLVSVLEAYIVLFHRLLPVSASPSTGAASIPALKLYEIFQIPQKTCRLI